VEGWRGDGQDVYVYFDNDVGAYAPFDAMELKRRLVGLEDAVAEGGGVPVVDSSAPDDLSLAATGRTG